MDQNNNLSWNKPFVLNMTADLYIYDKIWVYKLRKDSIGSTSYVTIIKNNTVKIFDAKYFIWYLTPESFILLAFDILLLHAMLFEFYSVSDELYV